MRVQAAKWALATLFLVDGVGFGVWAAHIPVVQRNLQLTTGSLALVLLCLVMGAIFSMPATGFLIARIGSRAVVRIAATSYIVMVGVLSQLNVPWAFMIGAGLFGAAKGAFDVSVNAQATAVEHHQGRSSMNMLQGCWSLGGLFGAGTSSVLLRHGMTARFDLLLATAILAVLGLAAFPWLVREPIIERMGTGFLWPDSQLIRLSILSFFGLFAEGAVGDWGAVYLHSNIGATLSWAAAGYAAYAIAMAASRFSGGWLAEHLSDATLLSASGLLLACGFGTVLLAHGWQVGFVGMALTGVGVANIIPVVMKITGRDTRMGAGPAISTVSTIAYFGFLAGPPLIGWVAHGIGLQRALLLVVGAGLVVAAGPRFTALDRKRSETPSRQVTTAG